MSTPPGLDTPSATSSGAGARIPALTGLRGLAALMVFLYHAPWLARIRGTDQWNGASWQRVMDCLDSGVALFFLLSGFLLALPFWEEAAGGRKVSLYSYGIRRAARILPGLWLALAVFQLSHDRTWTAQGMGVFSLAWFGLDGWVQRGWDFRTHTVLWTVSVELMFYALLPLVFFLVRPISPKAKGVWRAAALLIFCVGCGPLYAWLAGMAAPYAPDFLFGKNPASPAVTQSVFHYMAWFGFGAAGAWLWRTQLRNLRPNWLGDLVFFSACGYLLWAFQREGASEGIYRVLSWTNPAAWPGSALAFLVMILSAPLSIGTRALLDSRPLVILGTLSYGLYLWHVPIMSAAAAGSLSDHFQGASLLWVSSVAGLAGSLFVAWLMHGFLEKPAMNWAARQRSPKETAADLKERFSPRE